MNKSDVAKRIQSNCEFLETDSEGWATVFAVVFSVSVLIVMVSLLIPDYLGFLKTILWGLCFLGNCFTVGAWIHAASLGRLEDERFQRAKESEEEERRRSLQVAPPLPSPDPYQQTEAELKSRMEHAQKMQRLHELRQQVEEEERRAGIFAPTLSPPVPQNASGGANSPSVPADLPVTPSPRISEPSDPLAGEMEGLARRRQEAERQKHLLQSRRMVEDAEREADGL